ncbi:MAG: putative ABC transport system permease protein [Mariniblastus sp.]|jgi:putative ABC transport system permease protein
MSSKIPLAWTNLTHDPRRLIIAIAGIGFAVMLMFQQRGFRHALFDSTVAVVEELNADLIVFNRDRFALTSEVRFERDLLDVAQSTPGVESAQPLYMENQLARFRTLGNKARPIRVLAYDFESDVLLDKTGEISPQHRFLRAPGTALMDRLSKKNYGVDFAKIGHRDDAAEPMSQSAELSGRKLDVVGHFRLGRDFANDGTLIMSTDNFAHYFGYRGSEPLEKVDLGAIKIAFGQSPGPLIDLISENMGEQVLVMTKQQFIQREIDFWARNTPIGVIFAIGAIMGFVVGVIICYQVLANDIAEHLGEFATLKAMGYGNLYFLRLVIKQSVYLSLLGFLPGLCFSWLLFQVNSSFTGLLMNLSYDRILFVLFLTMLMCVMSGLLALRKLLAADPASLF